MPTVIPAHPSMPTTCASSLGTRKFFTFTFRAIATLNSSLHYFSTCPHPVPSYSPFVRLCSHFLPSLYHLSFFLDYTHNFPFICLFYSTDIPTFSRKIGSLKIHTTHSSEKMKTTKNLHCIKEQKTSIEILIIPSTTRCSKKYRHFRASDNFVPNSHLSPGTLHYPPTHLV